MAATTLLCTVALGLSGLALLRLAALRRRAAIRVRANDRRR